MAFGTRRTLRRWTTRLEAMKRCGTLAELLDGYGAPSHKDTSGPVEIWHYPLGPLGGMWYSIHVALADPRPQVYMHVVPMIDTASSGRAPEPPALPAGPPRTQIDQDLFVRSYQAFVSRLQRNGFEIRTSTLKAGVWVVTVNPRPLLVIRTRYDGRTRTIVVRSRRPFRWRERLRRELDLASVEAISDEAVKVHRSECRR